MKGSKNMIEPAIKMICASSFAQSKGRLCAGETLNEDPCGF